MENKGEGTLYLCATPIGNLEDITIRVLRILREVDIIAAESLSRTRKLLSHYDIHKPMVSYREEDRESKGRNLLEFLKSGKNVALVSDAGMPGLSDPGIHLIAMCRSEGLKIVCLPGPSAAISALVLSGFSSSKFVFEGFLPRKRHKRIQIMRGFSSERRTIVLFEAPHRLLRTLGELSLVLPDRKICVLREITKKFEEIEWGTSLELLRKFSDEDRKIRGEVTIVIEGSPEELCGSRALRDEPTVEELLQRFLERGYELKDAAKEVALMRAIPSREIYEKGLHLKGKK